MKTIEEQEAVIKANPQIVHVSIYNTRQPTAEDVGELVESMRSLGQATPALARPHPAKPGEYELATGARRRMACEVLGIELDLIVRPMTDGELQDLILADNLQHEDPSPESEAELIGRRLAEGMTPSAIAAKYGKADLWVLRRMKLLEIVPVLRAELAEGEGLSHYTTEMRERLGSLPASVQEEIAGDGYEYEECKTMEDLRLTLNGIAQPLKDSAWLEDPDTFVDGCGPGCATDTNKSVFPEPGGECGRCVHEDCFFARRAKATDKALGAVLGDLEPKDAVFFKQSGYGPVEFRGKILTYLNHYEFSRKYSISKKATPIVGIDITVPTSAVKVFLKAKRVEKSGAGAGDSAEKETREQKLTGKRLAAMNGKIKAALKVAEIPSLVPILNLVAAFGLSHSRTFASGKGVWQYLMVEGEVPVLSHGTEMKGRPEVLWDSLRSVLLQRLFFHDNRDIQKDFRRLEMVRIAELIGFDYDAVWIQICTVEVLVPKSWGKGIDVMTLEKEAA